MDPWIFFVITAAFAGFLCGALVGILVAKRRSRTEAKPIPEPPPVIAEKIEPPEPPVEAPVALTERSREGYSPLVCLWRNRETGRLATEIKGKLYLNLQALADDFKLQTQNLAAEWSDWMGMKDEKIGPRPSTAESASSPLPPTSAAGTSVKEKPALRLAAMEKERRPSPPSIKVQEVISTVLTPKMKPEDEAVLGPKSMVEEIDEILQQMLKDTNFDNQGIRIMEDPQRGVIVWVGLTQCQGIGEIKDPKVQGLVQKAVAEWERLAAIKRHGS